MEFVCQLLTHDSPVVYCDIIATFDGTDPRCPLMHAYVHLASSLAQLVTPTFKQYSLVRPQLCY